MWFLNPWSVIWKHGKWAKEECGIKESNLKVCLLQVSMGIPRTTRGFRSLPEVCQFSTPQDKASILKDLSGKLC